MSSEAVAWAFSLDVKPSSVKFTLVALCECANFKTGRIMPSIAHLCEITSQDRKTVISNIAELERRGYITDTGERCGRTGQIKVYSAEIGTVPKVEPSQERNSSVSPSKSPKNGTRNLLGNLPPNGDKKKRAHVLPDDWQPQPFSPNSKSQRIIDGWPPGAIDGHLEHFKAHHRARGSKFEDWQAAWSTWVINQDKFNGAQNGRQQGNQGIRQAGADRRSSLARAIDEGLDFLGPGPQAQVS